MQQPSKKAHRALQKVLYDLENLEFEPSGRKSRRARSPQGEENQRDWLIEAESQWYIYERLHEIDLKERYQKRLQDAKTQRCNLYDLVLLLFLSCYSHCY